MKTTSVLLLLGSLWLGPALASAQPNTNWPPPVISVTAPDAQAAEPADRGVFRVYRDGPTNHALQVLCLWQGTATNGVDYQRLTNVIPFRAGVRVAEIPVVPIDDTLVERPETVILRLMPPLVAFPQYIIGAPAVALVNLADNDLAPPTNQPPVVSLIEPTNGATFRAGSDVLLRADARDADGWVASVEFFAGTRSLGVRTNNPIIVPPTSPFFLVWSNVPAGDYSLRALATDDAGVQTRSEPVRILVASPLPVVTLRAADALATEPTSSVGTPDNAVLIVARDGATNLDLSVLLAIRGTANNGLDYAPLAQRVVIPRGARTAEIVIRPRADNLPEGSESVVVGLLASVAAYRLGEPSVAEARIVDAAASNRPPAVVLLKPDEGRVISQGRPIGLLADTWDMDGFVTLVEFFAGTNKLGEVNRDYVTPPPRGLHVAFQYIWSNAPLGRHELLARATDNDGGSTRSLVKHCVVVTNQPPSVTNSLPIVNLVTLDGLAAEGTNCWRWPGMGTCTNWSPTNRGPNVATFAVLRHGPTNGNLDVHYRISGTASNGVDYRTLSGVVALLAGERAARIVVTPMDDRIRERIETVELGLIVPPTDAAIPPTYQVGPQRRAAAIIVDNDSDRPRSTVLSDGMFHLQVDAANDSWMRVESTTNLLDWTDLGTCEVTEGALHFVDPDAPGTATRFYRIAPALSPDLE